MDNPPDWLSKGGSANTAAQAAARLGNLKTARSRRWTEEQKQAARARMQAQNPRSKKNIENSSSKALLPLDEHRDV